MIAWLIESTTARWGTGFYFTAQDDMLTFGTIDKAVRFCRKSDAETVARWLDMSGLHHGALEACEHEWVGDE